MLLIYKWETWGKSRSQYFFDGRYSLPHCTAVYLQKLQPFSKFCHSFSLLSINKLKVLPNCGLKSIFNCSSISSLDENNNFFSDSDLPWFYKNPVTLSLNGSNWDYFQFCKNQSQQSDVQFLLAVFAQESPRYW